MKNAFLRRLLYLSAFLAFLLLYLLAPARIAPFPWKGTRAFHVIQGPIGHGLYGFPTFISLWVIANLVLLALNLQGRTGKALKVLFLLIGLASLLLLMHEGIRPRF